jgi:hypothetical protein
MKTYIVTKENFCCTESVAEFKTEEEAIEKYNEILKSNESRLLEKFEWAKDLTQYDEANRDIFRFKVECFSIKDADDDEIGLETIRESDNYYLG